MAVSLGAKVCRQRLLEVLAFTDEEGPVVPGAVFRLVAESKCAHEHDLPLAAVNRMLDVDERGWLRLNSEGERFLLGSGHPASDWRSPGVPGPPLRDWQVEALDEWARHGRVGAIEAVTGTGKSRVGIEAIREALQHDYTALVVVPTVELVQQWIKSLRDHGIRDAAQFSRSGWQQHRVLVGTVQSLYAEPPVRADGKVLLVADECHRYGAGQWRNALHATYRRRLGLTATFERNDDGLETLLDYFGGRPIYDIGFDRAIADGVVASYDVKLLPVQLTARERQRYDEAEKALTDARTKLLAADLVMEPFGTFMFEVKSAAEDDSDPTVADVARRYLKAFSERVDILSSAAEKIEAVEHLMPLINASKGALFFTRRIDAAEDLTDELVRLGVRASFLHSGLTATQRKDRLSALRARTVQAVVAPTVLDEGIDVPEVDLGVVMAGSKSRRQMIQRMGRVLRAKPDGRSATFVVVYAKDTVEDLSATDGDVGCLNLIVNSARSVEEIGAGSADVTGASRPGLLTEATESPTPPVRAACTPDAHEHDERQSLVVPADVVVPEPSPQVGIETADAVAGESRPGTADAVAREPSPAPTHALTGVALVDALERLARLHDAGHLTREEYAQAKAHLLA